MRWAEQGRSGTVVMLAVGGALLYAASRTAAAALAGRGGPARPAQGLAVRAPGGAAGADRGLQRARHLGPRDGDAAAGGGAGISLARPCPARGGGSRSRCGDTARRDSIAVHSDNRLVPHGGA